MKAIKVGRKAPKRLTCLALGELGSGKTAFGATWPRPIFIGPSIESSWTTLDWLPNDHFYEPRKSDDDPPYVVAIEKAADMITVFKCLHKQARGEKIDSKEWPVPPGRDAIGTVVIDSFSEYAEMYLAYLEDQAGGDLRRYRQALYGDLLTHLRQIQTKFHDLLPYHVVWTGHPSKPDDYGKRGLALPGSYAEKVGRKLDLCLYLEQEESKPLDEAFVAYTRTHDGATARHRFHDLLPEKMEPAFEIIEESLGMEPWKPAKLKKAS